uniref:Uncharacterized protein n=1 Tax=Octopus bimaculoides TaxID=37653 RepID=A0A0L8GQG1_OCTBM
MGLPIAFSYCICCYLCTVTCITCICCYLNTIVCLYVVHVAIYTLLFMHNQYFVAIYTFSCVYYLCLFLSTRCCHLCGGYIYILLSTHSCLRTNPCLLLFIYCHLCISFFLKFLLLLTV